MLPENTIGRSPEIFGVPAENFSRGLLSVDLPGFGPMIGGKKVRGNWVVKKFGERIMVTPDKTSAYDKLICTVPGKGKVLNLLSDFWFNNTEDIIANHSVAVIHSNVLIARQAEETFPVEVIVREYMARSSTSTSIYHNYQELGRRKIYGIDFPEGLRTNEKFEKPIITPTTKAEAGIHDDELTNEAARDMVDSKFGRGTYAKAEKAALALFERGASYHRRNGLILVDTKYEFGLDRDGKLMLIDELHTPDSSRLWLEKTYQERFETGKDPESFDKEILRRWLADNGFRGEEGTRVPVVDPKIIDQMALAYTIPYEMVTGKYLPETPTDPVALEKEIQLEVNRYYNK